MRQLIFSLLLIASSISFGQDVYIPNEDFLNLIIDEGYDLNNDSIIQQSEAQNIEELDLYSPNDLTGIVEFTSLKHLHIWALNNDTLSFDVNTFTSLEYLSLMNFNDSFIDVSKLNHLKHLDFFFCKIESVNLDSVPNLHYLGCSGTFIDSLDVSSLKHLKELQCHSDLFYPREPHPISTKMTDNWYCCSGSGSRTNLKYLNVDGCDSLEELYCMGQNLTSLNVSSNVNLTRLDCWDNQLSFLDISNLTKLTDLDCSWNQLTNIDLTNNLKLKEIDISRNDIHSVNVSFLSQLTYLCALETKCVGYLPPKLESLWHSGECLMNPPNNLRCGYLSYDVHDGWWPFYRSCPDELCSVSNPDNCPNFSIVSGNAHNGSDDAPIAHTPVNISPGDIVTLTDENGNYFTTLPSTGDYSIWMNSLSQFAFIDSIQHISVSPGDDKFSVNFMAKLLGIKDINPSIQTSIYPNPISSSEFLNIQVDKASAYSLLDTKGQTIRNAELREDHISLEGIQPGQYFLLIETANGSVLERVVVQ